MSWSNEAIAEFLTLYEQEPSIWNPKREDHKDRNAVHDSWMRIQRNFSLDCTINDLKKKKESLMSTFRKLNTKVKASMKTGSSADDVYKPDWFAYDQMARFLQSVYSPRKTKNSEEQSEEAEVEHGASSNMELSENGTSTSLPEDPTLNVSNSNTFKAPVTTRSTSGASKKRKISTDEEKKRKEEAYNFLKAMRDKSDDDECSLFTELLCQKLRTLNENIRDAAMHEIDCIMFRFKQQQHNQQTFQHQNFSQPSHGFPSSSQSRPQVSQGFLHSPYPHSQTPSEFLPFPVSHSQPSPGFPPSPHIHPQPSPESSSATNSVEMQHFESE